MLGTRAENLKGSFMWISRVRITGGFLAGFDTTFDRGLNVVIGPRGAGKTTLLELIRHAVGAKHADGRLDKKRQEFLAAILGSGEIVIDLEGDEGGTHLVVDAKGGGQRSDLAESILVLGQNELESIASDASSRLNLLDLRTGIPSKLTDLSRAGEITVEMFAIRTQIEDLIDAAGKKPQLLADRDLLRLQEASLLGNGGAELAAMREKLRAADQVLLDTAKSLESISEVSDFVAETIDLETRQVARLEQVESRLEGISSTNLTESLILAPVQSGRSTLESLVAIAAGIEEIASEVLERDMESRSIAAPIREQLDNAEAGLGLVTAQLRNLDAELATLEAQANTVKGLQLQHERLSAERKLILDSGGLDEEELFEARSMIARQTTSMVSEHVVVVVEHLSDSTAYRAFLTEALRGTNTRSALIDTIGRKTFPRQLLEFVEIADAHGLSGVVDVPIDRIERVIDGLRTEENLRALSQVRMFDSVDFRLRDGGVEKSVDTLSTGQKCAVTLPIVLSERERTLVLDQPEDHLDNAYLVKHVVEGMLLRSAAPAQTIVATHNANIPVLGSANQVLVMASDGYNGSLEVKGAFDDEPIVDAITGLMEGGREAFAARSAFYEAFGSKP